MTAARTEAGMAAGWQRHVLDLLIDNLPMGIAVHNRDLVVERCSPTWARWTQERRGLPPGFAGPGRHLFEITRGKEDVVTPILAEVLARRTWQQPAHSYVADRSTRLATSRRVWAARARWGSSACTVRLVDVTLLYFDGCPNWRETEQRLRLALRTLGADEQRLERRKVDSPEEAERLGFRGSPTVLINGEDPFPDPSAPVALSCRLFRTPGGPAGAPTVDQLLQALRGRSADESIDRPDR